MRRVVLLLLLAVLLPSFPLSAQTISAGASAGITYLGGLQQALGVNAPSALSGTLFVDFDVGTGIAVRLGANFARAQDAVFSFLETNALWNFPLGRLRGFVGAGTGLFGMPVELSPSLHLSFQALVGLENDLLRNLIVKVTLQALQVFRVNGGFLPGAPLLRIEAGITLPFQS
ncbi:MAG TPA: hypothetical protein VIL47_04735 [Candidatus Bipolaricaulota bacterium]